MHGVHAEFVVGLVSDTGQSCTRITKLATVDADAAMLWAKAVHYISVLTCHRKREMQYKASEKITNLAHGACLTGHVRSKIRESI